MMFLSGSFFPIELMPGLLQKFARTLPLFYVNYSVWPISVLLTAMLVFVGCCYWGYYSTLRQMWRPIMAMVLIATAVTPWNPGSIALFAYCGFFIGFSYRPAVATAASVALLALLGLLQHLNQFTGPYFLTYGAVLLLGITLFGYLERLRQINIR